MAKIGEPFAHPTSVVKTKIVPRILAKEHLPFVALLLVSLGLLLFLATVRADPAMLPFHDIDESRFQQSLRRMYDGLVMRDLQRLFAFSFYNYGFGFFFLNLLVDLPFLARGNDAGAIVASRIVCGLFAIGTLALLYAIAIRFIRPLPAAGLGALLVLMPGFWFNAVWFHPDWMMTFFVVLAFERLLADGGRLGRAYWWAVVAFGLAFSVKQQALYYAPGLLIPLVVFAKHRRSEGGGSATWLVFLKSMLLVTFLFVATNPYLLHPAGRRQWLKITAANAESNRTNHFSGEKVGLAEKLLDAIQASFLPLPILFALLVYGTYVALKTRREPIGSVWTGLSVATIVSLAYLLFGVNKAWQHYYLPTVVLMVLMAIPILAHLRGKAANGILAATLALQVIAYGIGFGSTSVYERWLEVSPERVTAEANMKFAADTLAPVISRDDVVLVSSHTPFDYPRLGLKANQVRFIDGSLRMSLLDRDAFVAENPNRPLWSFAVPDFVVLTKSDNPDDRQLPDPTAGGTPPERLQSPPGYRMLASNATTTVYARDGSP